MHSCLSGLQASALVLSSKYRIVYLWETWNWTARPQQSIALSFWAIRLSYRPTFILLIYHKKVKFNLSVRHSNAKTLKLHLLEDLLYLMLSSRLLLLSRSSTSPWHFSHLFHTPKPWSSSHFLPFPLACLLSLLPALVIPIIYLCDWWIGS